MPACSSTWSWDAVAAPGPELHKRSRSIESVQSGSRQDARCSFVQEPCISSFVQESWMYASPRASLETPVKRRHSVEKYMFASAGDCKSIPTEPQKRSRSLESIQTSVKQDVPCGFIREACISPSPRFGLEIPKVVERRESVERYQTLVASAADCQSIQAGIQKRSRSLENIHNSVKQSLQPLQRSFVPEPCMNSPSFGRGVPRHVQGVPAKQFAVRASNQVRPVPKAQIKVQPRSVARVSVPSIATPARAGVAPTRTSIQQPAASNQQPAASRIVYFRRK